MKLKFLFVLAVLALIACGENTETVRVTDRYTLDMLGKGVSLTEEKCDSVRMGQLLYVGDSSSIYYCTGKSWKKVNGKDGRDGRDGKDGSDGVDGKRGEYGISGNECFIDEFTEGFVLGCGATKAVVRYNFEIPDTCSIKLQPDSSFVLICGEDTTTLLRGPQGDEGDICKQVDIGGGQVRLVCGADSVILYKVVCGETPFDPDGLQFCYGDSLVDRCNTLAYDIKKQFCYGDSLVARCGGETYELKDQFCYEDSLVDFCSGEQYDLKEKFCYNDSLVNLCGGEKYELTNQFCPNDSLVDLCNGKDYDITEKFCYNDSLVSLCGGERYELTEQFCPSDSLVDLCDGKKYELDEQFCFGDSLVPLCGGKSFELKERFCHGDSLIDLCGGKEYTPEEQFCFEGTIKDLCGGEKYDPIERFCKGDELYGKCGEQAYRVKNEFCDDRDGAIYRFTVIGGATWMAQNLDYKVPQSFCDSVQKDDDLHCGIKGRFYPWNVAMGKEWNECGCGHSCGSMIQYPHQGVCPDGWHIPAIEEWATLIDVMGTSDIVYWDTSVELHNRDESIELTNEYGFSAIPTGIVNVAWENGSFVRTTKFGGGNDGNSPIWTDGFDSWSSTEASRDSVELCFFYASNLYKGVVRIDSPYSKESTRTIRCVKD